MQHRDAIDLRCGRVAPNRPVKLADGPIKPNGLRLDWNPLSAAASNVRYTQTKRTVFLSIPGMVLSLQRDGARAIACACKNNAWRK